MLELRDEIQQTLDDAGLEDLYIDKDDLKRLIIVGGCGKPIATMFSIKIDAKLTKNKRELIIKYFNKWFDINKKDVIDLYNLKKDFYAKYKNKLIDTPNYEDTSINLGNGSMVTVKIENNSILYNEKIDNFFSGDYDDVFTLRVKNTLSNIEEIVRRKTEILDIYKKFEPYFLYSRDQNDIDSLLRKLNSCNNH
jgi:hypothetical protein